MKQIILLITITIIGAAYSSAFGQCKNFAKKTCRSGLRPYIHDGNYNAAILSEGEDAELYKTFFAKQEYRVFICYSDALPKIHFKVMDVDRNVLFDNKKHGYIQYWDTKPMDTQQLIIWIEVGTFNKEGDGILDLASGCVAIMFGLKED